MEKSFSRKKLLISALVIAYAAYPYINLYRLTGALEKGDKEAVNKLVNWDDLKKNFKDDMSGPSPAAKEGEKTGNALEQFGAAVAGAFRSGIASGMAEVIMTPAGLANVIGGESKDINPRIRYAFFNGITSFKAEFGAPDSKSEERVTATLTLQGGSWKLDRITLPQDK